MKNDFSRRDKSILIGLYLSKFDKKALLALGFKGYVEAFNILGYSIGTKPASIKNYRDEFDPLFPNKRKGWHKRPIREYCRVVYEEFAELSFKSFTELIKRAIIENYDIEQITKKVDKQQFNTTLAKRLATGKSAEEFFKLHYKHVREFFGFELEDTTNLACGFDFKLSLNSTFYCVEVKGLSANSGNIALTEKEFFIAKALKQRYCLFAVKNFVEKPLYRTYFDPLNSRLQFKRTERNIVQINYSTTI